MDATVSHRYKLGGLAAWRFMYCIRLLAEVLDRWVLTLTVGSYRTLCGAFAFGLLLILEHSAQAQQWLPLGPDDAAGVGIPTTGVQRNQCMALDATGSPVVAYATGYVDAPISVLRWNNNAWNQVGGSALGVLYDGVTNPLSLALDAAGNPVVAFCDGAHEGKVTVMRWMDFSWSELGAPGLSVGGADHLSLAIDVSGDPVVAYSDAANEGRTTVMRWDDGQSAWNAVGATGFSDGSALYQSLALDMNGDPVVAYSDGANQYKATVKRWDGIVWATVGLPGFSEGGASYLSLALDASGDPVVAYSDAANQFKTTVMRWNGIAWITVGLEGFSDGSSSDQSLALDMSGNPLVAFRDNSNSGTTVMHWDGSSWSTVGDAGSVGNGGHPGLAIDPGGYPVVVDQQPALGGIEPYDFTTTIMRWNGTSWSPFGVAGISTGNSGSPSLVLDGIGHPLVAFTDAANGGITVMRWDGTSWTTVGDAGSAGNGSYPSLAWDNSGFPVLAFRDLANGNRTTVVRWNGNSWVAIGSAGISAGEASYQSLVLDANGYPIVAYRDSVSDHRTTVMRWNGGSWTAMGGAGISAGGASQQSLALDASGFPMVAYRDEVGGGYTVLHWNGNNYWNALGDASGGLAARPSLVVGSDGTPAVAYGAGLNCTIRVGEWNGDDWEQVGGDLAFISMPSQTLALDPSGHFLVAYADYDQVNRATVKRWDGSGWGAVGIPGFTASIAPASSGNWLKADPQGNLLVAYCTRSPDYTGGYLFVKRYENIHITTDAVGGPLCAGASVSVTYTAYGTFEGGNIFTVQLSDSLGSFDEPDSIGSIEGITGGTINATIPPGTPAGSGYRIRVVSNAPSITGSDNGGDVTINVPGSDCNDNDDCTINDMLNGSCVCAGTFQDTDGDGVCNANDPCDNNTDGDACDDLDACTIDDVLNDCACSGTPSLTPQVTITVSPNDTVCAGTQVTFTAQVANTGGGSVTYDFKKNGSTVQNSGTNSLSMPSPADGDQITCTITVTGEACVSTSPVESSAITMEVSSSLTPEVTIVAVPDGSICTGTDVEFTATASDIGTGSVNYDFQVNGGSVQSGTDNTWNSATLADDEEVTCTITVTGDACVSTSAVGSAAITMDVNSSLTPEVTVSVSPNDTICAGTQVTFMAQTTNTGGGSLTYNFKRNGITVQNNGSDSWTTNTLSSADQITCTITVTGATCVNPNTASSNTITMIVVADPGAIVIVGNPLIADGVEYQYTWTATSIAGATYSWDLPPGWQAEDNITDSIALVAYAPYGSSVVTLCVTATVGPCVQDTCMVIQVIDVGTAEANGQQASFTVRPNPSDGHFELVHGGPAIGPVRFIVEDATGRAIGVSGTTSNASTFIDLGTASPGVYLLRIQHERGTDVLRLVIR